MTSTLTCAQCSRTIRRDEVEGGALDWVRISPIGQGDEPPDGGSEPQEWTLCSPECVSTWAAEHPGRSRADASLAPAGLYLG